MEIKVDRTNSDDSWKEHLFLVSSLPTRFLGLVTPSDAQRAAELKSFEMTKACSYICNIAFQQTPQGLIGSAMPHAVMKYDLMEVLETITITDATHFVRVKDQGEVFREWMFAQYLNTIDPPKVLGAQSPLRLER
jgi:hypothetical protein